MTSRPRRILEALWREALAPIVVVLAIALVVAALIEGRALEQFIYAVF